MDDPTHTNNFDGVVLTPELEAVVNTHVAAGETMKIEAVAGSGKSTALRLYASRNADRPTLYLTFTKAEAVAKQLSVYLGTCIACQLERSCPACLRTASCLECTHAGP